MKHIAIIGAGVTGATAAASLLERGFEVTVFDRNRYAAMETSFANGGQLSASNAEVWTRWATIFKGLKWMLAHDAPLLVNPTPSWRKYSWMLEFMSNIPNYRQNTVETVRLAIAARERLFALAERYNVDFACEKRGILHIYQDRKEFAHAQKVNALLAEGGLDRRAVTAEEVRGIEPALQGDFIGGCYTESDFTGDIHLFASGLTEALSERGVAFHYGAEVVEAEAGDGVRLRYRQDGVEKTERFDAVVVSAGVGSRDLAQQLGDRVPVYPVKGYSITVQLDDADSQNAAPWVSILDDEAKIVTSRLGAERFRIAGTAEFNGYNRDIRADRIEPLVKWCERLFPGVRTEHATPWAGLRPMTPSMMPRIGAGRRPGVFYNTGHGHLGWTLSAATAEILAESVVAAAQRDRPAPRLGAHRPKAA